MFSEILKIIPRLDAAALNQMEKMLGSRFAKIAKKFGRGIVGAMKGGGVVGVALGLIDKLLNPIKEVQEAIDRTLGNAGDLMANAEQFGTTAGKLAKLRALGESKGLDPGELYMLISKFQTSVAEAQADPTKYSAVRNYADTKDMADGFFQFIQQLQKMDKNDQILVQQQVFGEKQILKMAEFLQTDFPDQIKQLGIGSTERGTRAAEELDRIGDVADVLKARRNYDDMIGKSGVITEGMIRSRDQSARLELQKENARIRSYENLAAINDTVTKIMGLIENQLGLLGKLLLNIEPAMNKLIGFVDRIQKSKWAQRIFSGNWFGKGE